MLNYFRYDISIIDTIINLIDLYYSVLFLQNQYIFCIVSYMNAINVPGHA
jgi:hypothetical protein